MPKQEFPFPMPNGWFCVTRVGDVQKGSIKKKITTTLVDFAHGPN